MIPQPRIVVASSYKTPTATIPLSFYSPLEYSVRRPPARPPAGPQGALQPETPKAMTSVPSFVLAPLSFPPSTSIEAHSGELGAMLPTHGWMQKKTTQECVEGASGSAGEAAALLS